jgi:hypothetical protein
LLIELEHIKKSVDEKYADTVHLEEKLQKQERELTIKSVELT